MPKESVVEIPSGSGNKYRYVYDPANRATKYLGPVGDSPDLGEQEFMNLFNLNMNYQERDKIIFGKVLDWDAKIPPSGSFTDLSAADLQLLLDKNFIEADETQNFSPSTEDFLDFMKRYPRTTAHGYAISPKRDDYRVTLEGVEIPGPCSGDEIVAFSNAYGHADDFRVGEDSCFAWWD